MVYYYLPDTMCIIIASHISNATRITYLIECLLSLVHQSIPISTYLSISFETPEIRDLVVNGIQSVPEINQNIQSGKIILCIREHKTPQMRHIELVHSVMEPHHEWVLFCDDDDTYEPRRVETFALCIREHFDENNKTFNLSGLYESTFGKDHREHRHEYWCYCVRRSILARFFDGVRPYPDVLDNKCCDVLFAEYLRRLHPNHLFARITEGGYNYRVDNNADSITGFIKQNQSLYTQFSVPPPLEDSRWPTYVIHWNDYLHENMSVFLHDTYLRTLVGVSLNDILAAEFKANAPLLEYVDVCHVARIKENYERLLKVCNEIYDISI